MHDLDLKLAGKIEGEDTGIEIKKSICTICDPKTQCGLDLYVKDGKIIKVEGSKTMPHNDGTLCSKGAATRQYVYSPDRLRTPLLRVGEKGSGEFKDISWDEALDIVAEKLNAIKEQHGPESVAFYAGYSKWMRPYLHRLAACFGSPNYMSESSTCSTATAMAQKLVFGLPGGPDVKNAKLLLAWSSNPFYSNTAIARNILNAKDRGLKMIVVDPRYSPMASHADIHLQLRPGTDGALALALAHVIIEENLYCHDFVENYSYGFEEYCDYVKEFTPERGEELTGVPAAKIRAAARLYATTKPATIMPSASPVVHHTNGVQNYRAVFCLAALTGNYDVQGGNFVKPVSYLYQDAGFKSNMVTYAQPVELSTMPPRIGVDRLPVWELLTDEAQAVFLPHQIASKQPYPIKALFAMGLNYRMWPDSEFMAASLKELDFVVNTDLFMTDSCKYADIVLPMCSSVERSEFRCYAQNYVILTEPAISPLYESRSDTDVIFELARRLGLDDPLLLAGYEKSLDHILEPAGITVEELKKHPAGMPVPNPTKYPEKKYLKGGFKTPSGKMEFKSSILEKFEDMEGVDALPRYRPPKYSPDGDRERAKEYPFILNTGSRLPMFIHSRAYRMPWTMSLRPTAAADINPEDANALRLKQGDRIKISTDKERNIEVAANITNMVLPGVVHMFHGYAEANVNALLESDYVDPISGFPGYKSLLCQVEKIADKGR